MTSHEEWMRAALREADLAAEAGDVPVGAIVVSAEGHEIARGRNRREVDQDPTAHAEVVALRNAALATGHWRLEGSTVYVTLEPCPMCAGALINARVGHVVYGAADPKAGALQSLYNLGNDLRLNHRFDSTPGVLDAECVDRLRAFFAKLRAAGEK
ncbi:MAG TPA: tRNA adenosine(34) deaminase TadA [Polyangiaceae bacterium]|nr:tRNA adenosine(34) deaminase TadA [Polyangiaceae bacterium]